MHVSQTISMIHRDASFHRVCESLCVHGIGFTWFTECMYASQTLSMIHRDALFCRVYCSFAEFFFTELESVSQIFTDMTLVRLMCGQCVSKSIVVSQCLPTVHRVCQKNGSQSLAKRCLQCFISSIEFCFTEFAF